MTNNAKQLFELASLDAMGLLDEQERKAFEAAFASAPEHIKSQLRAQQSRLTQIEGTLPEVQAPASLRERTIDAVLSAAGQGSSAHDIIGRIEPSILPSRGVSPYWRTATIGSLAAAIVFGVGMFAYSLSANEYRAASDNDLAIKKFSEDFGPRFMQDFTNPRMQFVKFDNAEGAKTGAGAILMLDPVNKTGQIFCRSLPVDFSSYTLSIVDSNGNATQVVMSIAPALRSGGYVHTIEDLNVPAGARLEIRPAAPNAKPILASLSM